ncbi:hypothetical protein B0O99DRAFT_728022 [Bisporella sp. PMI_857]|nr:hypothetical protein B0O99DRAFT_728022 [Bisporella sp. PMI_857]
MNPQRRPFIEIEGSASPESRQVLNNDQIHIYVASFSYTDLGRLTFDAETYSNQPDSGRLGNAPIHEKPFVAAIFQHFSEVPCFWGQKNIWIWSTFIVFTEIIEDGNHYGAVKKLATKYDSDIASQNLLAAEMMPEDLTRESSDFRTYLFWRCWTRRPLENMPDPRDAQDSMMRSQLAWAYGTQACENLTRLVNEAKQRKKLELDTALGLSTLTELPQHDPLATLEMFLYHKFERRLNLNLYFYFALSGNGVSVYANGRLCVSFLEQDYKEWLQTQGVTF